MKTIIVFVLLISCLVGCHDITEAEASIEENIERARSVDISDELDSLMNNKDSDTNYKFTPNRSAQTSTDNAL
ncbi:MAG: hypothetical protein MK066_13445 [Crocinitomicaceae bacterium]|nr:hypothetical protein [Crocinitomicaceae bacterium]